MGNVNGLLINNDYMDIISNNIANASTIGYKSSKPLFFDMFSHSLYSNSTNGSGVGISGIVQNFNSGMLVETGRDLDLGIVKDGFFRVLDSQGHIYYTRDGQFSLDKDKNIINMHGMYLTGQNTSYSRNSFNSIFDLEPINLKHADILKEKPTSEITLKIMLNKNTDLFENIDSDEKNLSKPDDYNTYINIYNKNGEIEKINFSFNKTAQNTWKVDVKSDNAIDNSDGENINKSFELKFDSDGQLTSDSNINIQSNNSKYDNINLDLTGTLEQSDPHNYLENFSQNGYEEGFLKMFNIFPNGEIIATYSNEKTQSIGQILLSKFVNPEKLQPESGNVWSATQESGTEDIGIAGDTGFGVLTEKSLEASNVDLNKELINMIIAQRNYQSNAQSFKTEDKIINTLINL